MITIRIPLENARYVQGFVNQPAWRWHPADAAPGRAAVGPYGSFRFDGTTWWPTPRPAQRPLARPDSRERDSSIQTVKVVGRAVPFGQASAEQFSVKHQHWLRWRFEPGAFRQWLHTDYDIGLCVGHDGEFDRELASRKAGTLFLTETDAGLGFTALVQAPEPALAGLRGRAQAVSIRFKIRKSEIVSDRNWILPIEKITDADVYHVAIVPVAAMPGACCWLA